MNVANDVGELECEAEFLGKVQSARIVEAEDMGTCQTHSASDAIAVLTETIER